MARRWGGFIAANGTPGQEQLTGDFTGASPTICRLPDADEELSERRSIIRAMLYVRSAAQLRADYYGGINMTATPGIVVRIFDTHLQTVVDDVTGPVPVRRFSEWDVHAFDSAENQFGAGENSEVARWNFTNGVMLRPFERIEILLHADFSGLTAHTIKLLGTVVF